MTEKMHLVFGLVAALPEREKSAAFDELAARMREHDSVDIERKALPTYRALSESVREGKSDVAWLPLARLRKHESLAHVPRFGIGRLRKARLCASAGPASVDLVEAKLLQELRRRKDRDSYKPGL